MPNQIAFYPTPKPTHFWPMNEGSGSTFFDHVATDAINLAGTAIAWQLTAGMGPNPVAAFNGTTSFATAAAVDPTLNFNGQTPFSISFWFDTSSSGSESFFGNLEASQGPFTGWELTTGGASGVGLILVNNLGTNDDVFYLDGAPQPTLTPTNVVLTYDGLNTATSVKLYLNGVPTPVVMTGGLVTTNFSSATPFLIGARNNTSNFYQGVMAFVRVWNKTILLPGHATGLFYNGPQ